MNNPPGQSLGLLIWLIVPLSTALLLRAFAGDGWQDFGLRLALRGNGVWYVVSLLVYPVGVSVVLLIGSALGLISFPDFAWGRLLAIFALGFIPAFIKNIFEEFAWRGYLTPKVYSLGLNDYVGHSIVGLIWGCWHIPYLLFLLDRATLQAATTQSLATFIPMAIIGLVPASIVYGELRLLTHSVWPPLLLHTISNALVDVLVVQGFVKIVPGMDLLVSPGHQGILTTIFFLLVGIGLRQLRMKTIPAANQGHLVATL